MKLPSGDSVCVISLFRENYNLQLQVKRGGGGVQRHACGPELHRVRLLPQVLQERPARVPAGGSKRCSITKPALSLPLHCF